MAHGSSKFAAVVLSASCLTAGLFVSPAPGWPGSAGGPMILTGRPESVSAARVKPGRIEVTVTMNTYLGGKPRITITGVRGRAKGKTKTVRARSRTVVKALPPGRYKVSAKTITIRKRIIIPRVTPARVTLTRNRGAAVLVRYVMPGVPDYSQGYESTPVAVATDARFGTVTAGATHSCGIDWAGKGWCWGNDDKGRLGDGKDDQATEYRPVAVAGKHRFTTLTAAFSHTCGIDPAGKAWCWGSDADGKLGDGDDDQASEYSPVAVAGGHTFTTLAGGNTQTCGVDTAGKAWCWGRDDRGQVGDGDDGQGNKYVPVAVASAVTFTTVTAGDLHSCGVDTTGKAWCWGADYSGSLGDGDAVHPFEYSLVPVAVAGGHTFTTVTAGHNHTCGIDTTGAAWCWGPDVDGQLGDGDEGYWQGFELAPAAVAGGHLFATLTAGVHHTCGIDWSGTAWCWGADGSGRLGDGEEYGVGQYQPSESAPVLVAGGHTWTVLAGGGEHTCGSDTTGATWCWGDDHLGQVGDGDEYVPPF